MTRSRKHCRHVKATITLLSIVGISVTFNNREVFSGVMEMQKWVLCAQLSSYKVFRIAVNNTAVLSVAKEMQKWIPVEMCSKWLTFRTAVTINQH